MGYRDVLNIIHENFEIIMKEAVAVGIGYATHTRIDEINILQATYEAMREAISKLQVKPDILLNDAVTIPGVDVRQIPIIKGDAKSMSIAAASIIAKVTRDRLMIEFDKAYPESIILQIIRGMVHQCILRQLRKWDRPPYIDSHLLKIFNYSDLSR